MKFRVLFVLCLVMLSALAFADDLMLLVPTGQRTTNPNYVVPVVESPTLGFKALATPTLTITYPTSVQCPTLPAGTKAVRFWIWSGDSGANIGGSDVATGTPYPTVASATASEWFTVATTTPTIFLVGTAATTTATVQAK